MKYARVIHMPVNLCLLYSFIKTCRFIKAKGYIIFMRVYTYNFQYWFSTHEALTGFLTIIAGIRTSKYNSSKCMFVNSEKFHWNWILGCMYGCQSERGVC